MLEMLLGSIAGRRVRKGAPALVQARSVPVWGAFSILDPSAGCYGEVTDPLGKSSFQAAWERTASNYTGF